MGFVSALGYLLFVRFSQQLVSEL